MHFLHSNDTFLQYKNIIVAHEKMEKSDVSIVFFSLYIEISLLCRLQLLKYNEKFKFIL